MMDLTKERTPIKMLMMMGQTSITLSASHQMRRSFLSKRKKRRGKLRSVTKTS
jgi:hypothetical protein